MIEFRNVTVLQKEGKCYGNCTGGEADDVLRARSINSTTSRYLFTIHRIISRLHSARLLTLISPATAATNARVSDRLCSYDSRIEATSVCLRQRNVTPWHRAAHRWTMLIVIATTHAGLAALRRATKIPSPADGGRLGLMTQAVGVCPQAAVRTAADRCGRRSHNAGDDDALLCRANG